jgi:hypothetical protein
VRERRRKEIHGRAAALPRRGQVPCDVLFFEKKNLILRKRLGFVHAHQHGFCDFHMFENSEFLAAAAAAAAASAQTASEAFDRRGPAARDSVRQRVSAS